MQVTPGPFVPEPCDLLHAVRTLIEVCPDDSWQLRTLDTVSTATPSTLSHTTGEMMPLAVPCREPHNAAQNQQTSDIYPTHVRVPGPITAISLPGGILLELAENLGASGSACANECPEIDILADKPDSSVTHREMGATGVEGIRGTGAVSGDRQSQNR